ncbi:MAG: CoA ester lyase [Chloroflexota bacterium]
MAQAKPLRSMLWVPGNKEQWMQNAPRYGADALILDLEDSVPTGEKNQARKLVRKALDTLGTAGHTMFVRVNDLRSGLIEDDLEAVVSTGLYGIIPPKVEDPKDILETDGLLKVFELRAKLEVGTLFISPSIETAQAVREAYEICKASPRVAYMHVPHVKSGDLARALGLVWSREAKETLFIRSKVLVDARAAGDPYPCAGPWSDIEDLEGLRIYLKEMKQLGYTGFTALHPTHVAIANEIFTPSSEEIAYWQDIILAMEAAQKAGRASVLYKGQMIDIAMLKTAYTKLEMAKRFGTIS